MELDEMVDMFGGFNCKVPLKHMEALPMMWT